MSPQQSEPSWSRLDVERYCDGDLPVDSADRLRTQARTDPALARRLEEVCRFDDDLRRVLLTPGATGAAPWAARGWRWAVGAAACIGAVLFAASWLRSGPGVPSPRLVAPEQPSQVAADGDADPFRVVWEWPARRPAPSEPDAPPKSGSPAVAESSAAAPLPDDLEAALRRGDTRAAAETLASAEGPERDRMLRRLGEVIHSAGSAQRVLDGLSVEQQLEACRLWARAPGLQNIVFARLARLARDERTRPAAAPVVGGLAGDVELLPWLRRYGLAGGAS